MSVSNSRKIDAAWADDKLSRQECAIFLTSYLTKRFGTKSGKRGEDSFVLNLNSRWGLGKTFFLKNWKTDLERTGFPVIYYDAWKNDFSDEPLLGFISQLEASLDKTFRKSTKAQQQVRSIVSSARKLLRPSLPMLAAVLAKKMTGMSLEELMDELDHIDENTDHEKQDETFSKIIEKTTEQALKEHKTKQKVIALFRENLKKLITHIDKNLNYVQLPIFVMIDELDRCRPTYAIELLEHIKHIFGVPGICFIVATDSRQLAASIKAVYGIEFDAERYLQRFFDQEYNLPDPDFIRYANFLFEQEKFNLEKLFNPFEFSEPKNPNAYLFAHLSKAFHLTLRGQLQCFETFRAIYLMWQEPMAMHVMFMLFLIILRHLRLDAFDSFAMSPTSNEWIGIIGRSQSSVVILPTREFVGSSHYSTKPSGCDIQTVINEYTTLATSRSDDIFKRMDSHRYQYIRLAANELTNQKPFEVTNNPLKKYISIVRQAGQLS